MEFLRADYTEVWVPSAVVPLIRFADRVRSIAGDGSGSAGPAGCATAARTDGDAGEIRLDCFLVRSESRGVPGALDMADVFLPALPGAGQSSSIAPISSRSRWVLRRRDSTLAHSGSGSPSCARDSSVLRKPAQELAVGPIPELAQRSPFPVSWCAGPEETLDGAVRIDDLWELACWIARARVYIGNDSGITHLAAATGVPVVAIFGPTDPADLGSARRQCAGSTGRFGRDSGAGNLR